MRSGATARVVAIGVLVAAFVAGSDFLPGVGGLRRALRDELGSESWLTPLADAPSSRAVKAQFLEQDQWLVSLAIPEEALHDPKRGILANAAGRGREWEREAWLSVYRGQRPLFATRVGVRLHGSSRRGRREAFRVIFRRSYGLPSMPVGGPLQTATRPADRFVIRRSQVMPQTLPMAFEIAQRIGAVAPSAASVRFVVNGSLRPRAYELTEHVSREGWGRAFFGHDDFRFYQFRASRLPEDEAAYGTLREWVSTTPARLLMHQAAERVDLENFMRRIFTFMYCGTQDWAQGAGLLDLRSPSPRWAWVHWDLDQSFAGRTAPAWKRPSIELLLAPRRPNEQEDVRALLFQRLVREDPQFVRRFTQFVSKTLNHSLTREYLRDLVGRYEALSVRENPFRGFDLRSFFDHRGDEVFDALADALSEPRPHTVQVSAPPGVRLQIDGYEHDARYTGRYFDGTFVTVRAIGPDGGPRSQWDVNGSLRQGDELKIAVDRETSIRVGASPDRRP